MTNPVLGMFRLVVKWLKSCCTLSWGYCAICLDEILQAAVGKDRRHQDVKTLRRLLEILDTDHDIGASVIADGTTDPSIARILGPFSLSLFFFWLTFLSLSKPHLILPLLRLERAVKPRASYQSIHHYPYTTIHYTLLYTIITIADPNPGLRLFDVTTGFLNWSYPSGLGTVAFSLLGHVRTID
ncbi:hypothetical protein F4811DRAFT_322096 [Daldinia bambusicola]|nr:hypothetical protein F4811DRAFT_322096 [Daldinia bambusicola]